MYLPICLFIYLPIEKETEKQRVGQLFTKMAVSNDDRLVTMGTKSTQILISKCDLPLKEFKSLGKIADSRSEARKISKSENKEVLRC